MEKLKESPTKYMGVANLWDQKFFLGVRGHGFAMDKKAAQADGCTWTEAKFDAGLGEASFTDEYSENVLSSHKG